MPIIPIGTDVRPRHAPVANYALIAINGLVFLFTDMLGAGGIGEIFKTHYALDAARPYLYQYITYQFLHGDVLHLFGNMLFLWIFGNAVCDRLGTVGYLLFYLAGGVFAGVAFTSVNDNPMVGASGAIAAVTTAFLALFPRVQITLLIWMLFIFTFQVPAMILIIFKIILWDNVLAPQLESAAMSNVAYSAHLGGYAFGFVVSMVLLLVRALPRNPFDILSLISREQRKRGWTATDLGMVAARPVRVQEIDSRPLDTTPPSPTALLREEIATRISARDPAGAIDAYLRLRAADPDQVLRANHQIEIANAMAQAGRYADAADAYEIYLRHYPTGSDVPEIRLFLGMIYGRYLADHPRAVSHLRESLDGLRLGAQRELAEDELRRAEAQLGPG